MAKTFNEIADEQGWNITSRYTVLRNYLEQANLMPEATRFAQQVADTENESAQH